MATTDSLSFGLPTGLLVSSAEDPGDAPETTFGPSLLLVEPLSSAQDVLDTMMDYDATEPSQSTDGISSLGSGLRRVHLTPERTRRRRSAEADDMFVPTGLLSQSLQLREAGSSDATFPQGTYDSNISQSQDLPDVSDLLRPYAANASTSSGAASFSTNIIRGSSFDGGNVFLKRKSRRQAQVPAMSTANSASGATNFSKLLDVPIHRLLDQLSLEAATRIAREDSHRVDVTQHPQPGPSTDTSLWVDRYRPKRFTDLLGDDRVHREVMSWVKEWDHCVFGRRQGRKRPRGEEGENLDEWRRPKEKLLLLSGPPGLGKTTLAHVVAQHAGYSVFEINASDARSAQVVEERLKPALESGSTVGSKKPTLVVIDEIDGATGGTDNSSGFIQKLIQLTYDKPRKKGKKADPKAPRPLLRPIICICNDLFASSLTKLRVHTRVVRFSRPNDIQLVRRLREICETEGLKAESRALTTLVGVAQGDLRGCLNTLQMFKARGREVTEPVVRMATAGMKETEASYMSVLQDLFSPMPRKRVKDLGLNEEEEARYADRLSHAIEGSGAMDKIAQGCFEHYANLHRHDASFSRYLKAEEWLTVYDVMAGEMRSEREYALMQYLPYMLVPFYPLFQERGGPKIERPKADWENYQATKTNEEIYQSLARCLRSAATRHCGDYRHLASDQILQLELAPLLNRIISPPLKPVNRQIIRPGEKAVLSRLVDLMVALEMRFFQEKMEDGQLTYRLDPPVDVFVTYDGKRAADIAVSKYAVRHLVAAEIDARLASLQADNIEKSKPNKSNFFKRRTHLDEANEEDVDDINGKLVTAGSQPDFVANKRARIDKGDITDKVAADFFGRPILPSAGPAKQSSTVKPENQNHVSYRFNEGNSAAVRKPIKVGSFL